MTKTFIPCLALIDRTKLQIRYGEQRSTPLCLVEATRKTQHNARHIVGLQWAHSSPFSSLSVPVELV